MQEQSQMHTLSFENSRTIVSWFKV